MSRRKSLQGRLILGLIVVSGCLTLMQTPAYPEAYIAGQFGISIPGSLSDIDVTSAGLPGGVKFSDLDLQNSFLFGAKIGYFSQSVRWFGVEAEIFHTTPHVKQQAVTVTGPGGSVTVPGVPGQYFSMWTLAPNLVFRYPGKRFQPYVGVGPGIFFARLKDAQTEDSQSSTRLGLNAEVGLRYFLARHVALFGEYKFNYARLGFNETANLDGFDATYMANNFVFGIGYHF